MLVLQDIIFITVIAGATACVAMLLPLGQRKRTTSTDTLPEIEPIALLFDGGFLHHATHRALRKFAISPDFHMWSDLRKTLLPRFPDLPETLGSGEQGIITLLAIDEMSPHQIEMSWRGDLCWVTMTERTSMAPQQTHFADNIALYRTSQVSKNPIWHLDLEGRTIWTNAAYRSLKHNAVTTNGTLFETPPTGAPYRTTLSIGDDGSVMHFAVSHDLVEDVTVCQATCIDDLVAAERAKRHFVQTLSKTFAHLPIGLAIFDRNRQLALFNPALVDLSGLSAPFLSRRPTILSFFDQMRENRQMPEPKNYNVWREKISELIAAAADGLHKETWLLEDGRTYSVQGRPHPDGATAFMIEDISAEITLTRNFRKEVELGHALLDQVDEGIAVFSSSGILTFCNATYRKLWGHVPEDAFVDVTIYDAISVWRAGCESLSNRDEIERFVMSYENQDNQSFGITLSDGRPYICDLKCLNAGVKMIRFRAVRTPPKIPYSRVHQDAI